MYTQKVVAAIHFLGIGQSAVVFVAINLAVIASPPRSLILLASPGQEKVSRCKIDNSAC